MPPASALFSLYMVIIVIYIYKLYYDYEKEENWLNEMSANGMTLTKYTWCRYVFTEAPKNEYIYRLELLQHSPSHPESIAYIKFLEETGVECIIEYIISFCITIQCFQSQLFCWMFAINKSIIK
ncbi:DUF2812 domain-containing protein [Clostridium algoriphilum]|uniref:DUF2812 domain-containing protein n=1 Tax=Clostridium algoriphilum TaxID=198347 RepID=UPI001CF38E8D|nr:DUF2812 domain-containing protein [Clostridium algoriphilum]MCB2293245.1 DUF2812 domain-containing protein [Clostridium algoriphilum]